jgi:hypothetical protein
MLHKNLAQSRWLEMSFIEQMANIGSEVHRVLHWQGAGEKENKENAFWRALELIDLTISDKRWQIRLKELTRLREILCDLFVGGNVYNISSKNLENYFLSFALMR